MAKLIKMQTPPGLSKREKLIALFHIALERAKAKILNMQKPPAVPSKYTFLTFLKAVVSDLVTIVTVLVIGSTIGICVGITVLYALMENSVIVLAGRLKARRKRNFKLKKV